MTTFSERLMALCVEEMEAAQRDPDRADVAIERLAFSLSFAAAFSSGGDREQMEKILETVSGFMRREMDALAAIIRIRNDRKISTQRACN